MAVSVVNGVNAQPILQADLYAEKIDNYARLIINFKERYDLPEYSLRSENNILILKFTEPVNFTSPNVSEILDQFIIASRTDPDKMGIRFALRKDFLINKMEAGEQLFIDILPADWQGALPGLPEEVVEKLALRTKEALKLAEQKQKEKFIRENNPTAILHVGKHPSFVRLLVDWSIDVEAEFSFREQEGILSFDWPVPIDLYQLNIDLPKEIISVRNEVDVEGSKIFIEFAKGVKPRFFTNSKRQYIIDVDLLDGVRGEVDLASILPDGEGNIGENGDLLGEEFNNSSDRKVTINISAASGRGKIVEPEIEKQGSTIKITYPFEDETAAAVFKRGQTLWMVFETYAFIKEPANLADFAILSDSYSVINGSGTSIVRINLPANKLATLGSEGRSWVLSLGDIILTPGEQISLEKKQNAQGLFEIIARLDRAANIHQIRDPEVGDILEVVTVFPPTLSLLREQSFVEFKALKTVHGIVIQPLHENILLGLSDGVLKISSKRGLIISTLQSARVSNAQDLEGISRAGFIDLNSLIEKNPRRFRDRKNGLAQLAASAGQGEKAQMLLNLAQFNLANGFSYEALGILNLAESELSSNIVFTAMQITKAAALVLTNRNRQALELLNNKNIVNEMDAMIWRTIARHNLEDYKGAREDALSAEVVIENYPDWVKNRFFLSATEAAIEYGDIALAIRYLSQIETAILNEADLGKYIILSGRIDESQGRYEEALDTYGQVISSDNRPARAEAIYQTVQLLRKMGRLNSAQAAETLAYEIMLWRGGRTEVKMLELLAKLYFESANYREAFASVRQYAKFLEPGKSTDELLHLAQQEFSALFLDGKAESLDPVKALSLYYDYRYLTPAGAKGDQMIRNLARRLVKVDLLEQAAELLQYQVDERLEGVAKVQIAADLAVIYLANKEPEKAIRVLNSTRLAGIPASLERQRRILEARALIDVGREDLALDILAKISGKDADLLRIDAHWNAKRYSKAAEIIERLYQWEAERGNLSVSAQNNIIKAAVGYVLDNDIIGLDRLRLKYSELMAKTPKWPLFKYVASDVDISSLEFSKVVSEIADINSMNEFLTAYRENYGSEGALTPKNQ